MSAKYSSFWRRGLEVKRLLPSKQLELVQAERECRFRVPNVGAVRNPKIRSFQLPAEMMAESFLQLKA